MGKTLERLAWRPWRGPWIASSGLFPAFSGPWGLFSDFAGRLPSLLWAWGLFGPFLASEPLSFLNFLLWASGLLLDFGPRGLFWAFSRLLDLFPTFSGPRSLFWAGPRASSGSFVGFFASSQPFLDFLDFWP